MSNELLDALNSAPAPESSIEIDEQPVVKVEKSETALQLDDWSKRKGLETLQNSDRLREAFGLPESAFTDRDGWRHTHEGDAISSAEISVADFFGAAFEPEPKLAEACVDERRHRFVKGLLETNEFQSLHLDTQLDEVASEIAAASFSEQFVALCQTDEPSDEFQKNLQALTAASKAVKESRETVNDLRDAQAALGHGAGNPGAPLNPKQLAEMFKRINGNSRLKRICELAGRYRRFAQAQQRKKTLHGRDDMVGVMLDGDPGKMLPHELVQLDDPDLEMDAMRRMIERQSMCRDYRGVESRAKGPICVVVDESGSMGGDKIANAKAIALALAWVARHQRRWVALVGFSGGTEGNYLAMPPNRWDTIALMEWMEHFYGGGTDCDVPLIELPKKWDELGAPKGKTDIIVITDAIIDVPKEVERSFNKWKIAESVKMFSIVLAGEAGDLAPVSDKVYLMRTLSIEEDGVQEVLGV